MKHKTFLVAASILMLSIGLSAQPEGVRPAPPKQMTPEEIAKKKADMMMSELNLTDKQYKKVYKLIKKDHEYRQSQMKQQFGEGMPPMGGGPGMGGPGMGGPGMGGPGMGNPGMGGPGGMGGERPPQGEMGARPEGGFPGMGPREDVITEEYLEKQDQKLKEILTAEQYSKWRSKHPAEHLELPPMQFEK